MAILQSTTMLGILLEIKVSGKNKYASI